jgi:hypothetical protein
MVAFTPAELKLPDVLRGKKVKEYLISKYPNTLIDGVPYSLPFQKPAVDVDHDEAIRLCESKGPGWHLITNDEWTALGRQSWENDTMPTGNTNSGRSHSHPEQCGTTYEGGYGKVLTGSGPVEWNHDRTAAGVSEMCGGVWEHVGGVRFLDGQVQVIPNNEAAAGADQSKSSPEWQAIYTEDGDPVYYNVHDGEITLQPYAPTKKDYDGVKFTELEVKEMDVPDKLIELGLYPADGYESDEYFWMDTDGERVIYRGGSCYNGANAGVFYLNGYYSRGLSLTSVGFRSAFVRYSGDSGDLDNLDNEGTDLSDAPEEIKETIKENDEKLKAKQEAVIPGNTLEKLVREMLARSFVYLCNSLDFGEPTPSEVHKAALEAPIEELQKASGLLGSMAQAVTAVNAARTSIAATAKALEGIYKKEGGPDHE